MAAMAAN